LDIKLFRMNPTSAGSRPTPLYDHYKIASMAVLPIDAEFTRNSESKREFLY